MTRTERNEFNYIRKTLQQFTSLGYGSTLTIRTDASSEYKHALHEFYTSLGFHPADIRTDPDHYDDKERLIYIYGLTWEDDEGKERSWKELYTEDERKRYSAVLDED